MTAVKIADLKNNLSRHLARVRRGADLIVLDRDTPVARIVPFTPEAGGKRAARRDGAATEATDRIAALTREGVLSPGSAQAVADWVKEHQPVVRPAGTASAVDLLLEMRREPRR